MAFENDRNSLPKELFSSGNIKKLLQAQLLKIQMVSKSGQVSSKINRNANNLPPTINQSKSKEKDQNLDDHNENKKVEYLQKEALEDWYGRMRDDGSFPI